MTKNPKSKSKTRFHHDELLLTGYYLRDAVVAAKRRQIEAEHIDRIKNAAKASGFFCDLSVLEIAHTPSTAAFDALNAATDSLIAQIK